MPGRVVDTYSSRSIDELLAMMTADVVNRPRPTASPLFQAIEHRGLHRGEKGKPDKVTLAGILKYARAQLEQETETKILLAFAKLINSILDDVADFDDGLPRQSFEKAVAKIPPHLAQN